MPGLVRICLWGGSVGFVLLMTVWGTVAQYNQGHLLIAIAWAVVGSVLFKITAKIWVAIFGRLGDKMWVRPD